jgi:hypothetical protein
MLGTFIYIKLLTAFLGAEKGHIYLYALFYFKFHFY